MCRELLGAQESVSSEPWGRGNKLQGLLLCTARSCVCGVSIALCPGTALTVGINVCCQIRDLVVLWVLEEGNDPYDLT